MCQDDGCRMMELFWNRIFQNKPIDRVLFNLELEILWFYMLF